MDTGEKPQPNPALMAPKININETRQMMIMCPAIMLANNRIIKAIGFVNIPMISTGIRMNFTGMGTPGGQKVWLQK